jgi:hypothetical protein
MSGTFRSSASSGVLGQVETGTCIYESEYQRKSTPYIKLYIGMFFKESGRKAAEPLFERGNFLTVIECHVIVFPSYAESYQSSMMRTDNHFPLKMNGIRQVASLAFSRHQTAARLLSENIRMPSATESSCPKEEGPSNPSLCVERKVKRSDWPHKPERSEFNFPKSRYQMTRLPQKN